MKQRVIKITLKDAHAAKILCICFAISLILTGFIFNTPGEITEGLFKYISYRAALVTDYFDLGSFGAAFVNAGLVTLISIGITLLFKSNFTGNTVAALFLMPGFALFGKNPVNILPFFIGVWLYCKYKRVPLAKYTTAALYSTTLAPVVSEIMYAAPFPLIFRIILAFGAGVLLGFIIIPFAEHVLPMHKGYVLFNFGFACGLMAYVMTCITRSVGITTIIESYWHSGINTGILIFVSTLCGLLILTGLLLSSWEIHHYPKIMRHHGRAPHNDHIESDGIGNVMVNMGIIGGLCLAYIVLIGGDLNGPVVGGILTAIGFGASGVHPRNFMPILMGVWLYSLIAVQPATAPAIQLAAIFGATALAPIAGDYGYLMGIAAGCAHYAIVILTTESTGGLNLYNNGFSAGFVAAIMVTLADAFNKKSLESGLHKFIINLFSPKSESSNPKTAHAKPDIETDVSKEEWI